MKSPKYSQPPLMNRHNRGDLREEEEKKKTGEPRENKKVEGKVWSNKAACQREISPLLSCCDNAECIHAGCTHTFSSSDVNRAGDVGDPLIHAHLQVDHPAKHKPVTDLIIRHTNARASHTRAHICLFAHSHGLVSGSTVRSSPEVSKKHSSIRFVHTCCFISAQTCWHRHKAKALKEVREFSTHRRNLFCFGSDPDL